MEVSFNGISEQVVSFIGTNVEIGDLVMISGNGKVSKALSDLDIIGMCVTKRDDLVGVLLHGAIEVGYSGSSAPNLGMEELVTAGSNLVKVSSGGRLYLVVSTDITSKKVTILL